jgi:LAO/AO transport system kinase
MAELTIEQLVEGVRSGKRRPIARAISLVENRAPNGYELLKRLYPETGKAYAVGLTGSPGVGKSTLASALVGHTRAMGKQIGVISVDPSSPFTQGALLGDRIRLSDHFLDEGVFIRSMGARGHLGGLAQATLEAALVLDAAGKEIVFLETVGTGQSEVEVRSVADTVVLVLMPGSGDAVQALKAGIMEIPNVIAINKRNHPQAKTMLTEVRQMLALGEVERMPSIVLTEAIEGEGIEELWAAVEEHRDWLGPERLLERRRARMAVEVFAIASERAKEHLERKVADDPELQRVLRDVQDRKLDPLSAVREIVERVFAIDGNGTDLVS